MGELDPVVLQESLYDSHPGVLESAIALVDATAQEKRVRLSLMTSGLENLVSPREMVDLLAFLRQ